MEMTSNPITGAAEQKGPAPAAAQESKAVPSMQSRMHHAGSTGSREERWKYEMEKHSGLRRMLLFIGIERPSNWWSPWWSCWFGWRAVTVVQLILQVYYLIYDATVTGNVKQVLAIDLPQATAALIALHCFIYMRGRAKQLMIDEAPLRDDEISQSVNVALLFILVCIVATVGPWIYDAVDKTWEDLTVPVDAAWGVPFISLEGIYLGGSVVFHGAALLVYSLEATHATNEVLRLCDAAERKQLTRSQYRAAQDFVEARSDWWKLRGGSVVLAAFYNTLAMVVVVHNPKQNPYFQDDSVKTLIKEDIFHITFLGKEVLMLFFMLGCCISVNDLADSITTVLNKGVWGHPGSVDEARRMDLMLLTTTYSTTQQAAESVKGYLTTSVAGPISFRLCGTRPTKRLFTIVTMSLLLSLLTSILRTYAENG